MVTMWIQLDSNSQKEKQIFNRFDNRKWEGGKTEKNENDGKQRQVVPNEELEKGRKEAESAKTTVDKRRIATEEMEGKST